MSDEASWSTINRLGNRVSSDLWSPSKEKRLIELEMFLRASAGSIPA
jgi:hypothetical protein